MDNRKTLFVAILFATFFSQVSAQGVEIIGINNTSSGMNIVKWNSDSSTFSFSQPVNLSGVLVGTSVFDSYTGKFYIRGVENVTNDPVILEHNTNNDSTNYASVGSFYNGGADIDMSTGFIYTYVGDVNNNVYLNQYDPSTQTNFNMGYFNFGPNTSFFPDATCFDSNNHIYYFIIVDAGGKSLVSIPVNAPTFTYNVTPLNGISITGNMGLEYSNNYDMVYMLYPTFNSIGTPSLNIGSVDPLTATVTPLRSLVDIFGYYFASRTYDQYTDQLIFMAIDTTNTAHLYLYQTQNDTLTIGQLPNDNTIEIECNNYNYAKIKYGVTSISETDAASIPRLFPNPAKEFLAISNINVPTTYQVFDTYGKSVKQGIYQSNELLDIQELRNGLYIFQTSTGINSKFVKY